jgi:hypothetical protein
MPSLHTIEQRLIYLERRPPPANTEPLEERIKRYIAIMDSEDYDSSEDGRALKETIERYASAIKKELE